MPRPPRGTGIVAFGGSGQAVREKKAIGRSVGEMKCELKNCNLFAIRKVQVVEFEGVMDFSNPGFAIRNLAVNAWAEESSVG
jgi:hypothetical protein